MSIQGLGQAPVPQFGAGGVNNNQSGSALMQKCLNSATFKSILSGFGIKEGSVTNVVQESGIAIDIAASLHDLQLIQMDVSKANTLRAFGLEGAEMAMVMQSEEEIKNIKKKLKEIKASTFNKKTIQLILQALGVPINSESLIFKDEEGGLYIIQSQFERIQQGLDLLAD